MRASALTPLFSNSSGLGEFADYCERADCADCADAICTTQFARVSYIPQLIQNRPGSVFDRHDDRPGSVNYNRAGSASNRHEQHTQQHYTQEH